MRFSKIRFFCYEIVRAASEQVSLHGIHGRTCFRFGFFSFGCLRRHWRLLRLGLRLRCRLRLWLRCRLGLRLCLFAVIVIRETGDFIRVNGEYHIRIRGISGLIFGALCSGVDDVDLILVTAGIIVIVFVEAYCKRIRVVRQIGCVIGSACCRLGCGRGLCVFCIFLRLLDSFSHLALSFFLRVLVILGSLFVFCALCGNSFKI